MPWTNSRPYQYRPNAPLVNPDSGVPHRDGIDLLLALYNRSGAGTGIQNQVTPEGSPIDAAGSHIGDATALTHDWNEVTTTAANQGVQVPALQPGQDIVVKNSGNHNLNVYPPDGASTINAGAAGHPLVVAPGTQQTIRCWTLTKFNTG